MTPAELLTTAVRILESHDVPYMIVGSFASTACGEPRFTQDIDIVVDLSSGKVNAFCDSFSPEEFYLSRSAVEDAVRRRRQFNAIHPRSGNKLDFMLARFDPWGKEQLGRRRRRAFLPDLEAYAAGPEDIIISKMLYYRERRPEKHTRDIAGMLRISDREIDRAYIGRWSEQLGLKGIWETIVEAAAVRAPPERPI